MFSLVIYGVWVSPETAEGVEAAAEVRAAAEVEEPQEQRQLNGACTDMTVPEENHGSIRLRVDHPASEEEVAVDERGEIAINGILHKHATMVGVSDEEVTASDFTFGPPPEGEAAWSQSWSTTLRPPHLGENTICARAERDPKRSARVLRDFTVVDLIPPSDVPGLAVGDVSSTGATVTWGAASDNYGLAGYEVTVDGGSPERSTVDTRSYTITGLEPSTSHTVSVVAIDLAGNISTTPATVSFTTEASSPPPPSDGDLTFEVEEGGANAFWDADDPADASYRVFLNERSYESFDRDQFCEDENGDPAIPCTTQDVIGYPIAPLEEGTLYVVRVEVLGEDGALERTMRGSFTTTTSEEVVPPKMRALIATEGSRCAAMGGAFYVAPDARAGVSLPTGSSEVFAGCHTVQDSSCLDAFIPLSGDQIVECVDDLTGVLRALAPPGGGPVISSLDDAENVGTSSVQVESVSWCHDGACALVLAPVAQVAAVVDVAPRPVLVRTVVVAASAIGVSAAAVGGAAALGVLLALLFEEELGTAGLLEYPIDASTDFEAFDNWGLSNGEFYNSLQMYGEVIKTTNQIARRDNLSFGWASANDVALKRMIDIACSVQQGGNGATFDGCKSEFAVYVPGAKNYTGASMPKTGEHIVNAMFNTGSTWPVERYQWHYPARSIGGSKAKAEGYNHKWFNLVKFRPNPCDPKPFGDVCDEFPFWATDQAVDLSGITASRQIVPKGEETSQGTDINGFFKKCAVGNDEKFIVLPIEHWVTAGGPSFGFRVTNNGTSSCLIP
ncbi:fibronectin type III domain-containing protein [Promicromonospora soli]|uniref:fibronectin type III domain-containing protein n=1 Tax=Promicromonospora soli TaxID=2035533 RepID=UPI001E60951F|nr:fibronectin type III domain-containing protein [Promicromonospora soli]